MCPEQKTIPLYPLRPCPSPSGTRKDGFQAAVAMCAVQGTLFGPELAYLWKERAAKSCCSRKRPKWRRSLRILGQDVKEIKWPGAPVFKGQLRHLQFSNRLPLSRNSLKLVNKPHPFVRETGSPPTALLNSPRLLAPPLPIPWKSNLTPLCVLHQMSLSPKAEKKNVCEPIFKWHPQTDYSWKCVHVHTRICSAA